MLDSGVAGRAENVTVSGVADSTDGDGVDGVRVDDSSDLDQSADEDRRGVPRPDKLPVKMMNDRILVKANDREGERRSSGGIVIPATAQVGKRLTWATVMAVGPNVRAMESGDRVLFNPEDRYEVEVRGKDYVILRERDVHALAAQRLEEGSTGLYL